MVKRILVALLVLSTTCPAFASDSDKSIADQATALARDVAAQPVQPEDQPQTPPIQTPSSAPDLGHGSKKSKLLLISGIGLIAFGAAQVAYGTGQFGSCAGSTTSTQIYSNANACYSDKVTGWMLGIGGGSILVLGSLLTHSK